jgi:hypothetical protein
MLDVKIKTIISLKAVVIGLESITENKMESSD